MVIGGLSGTAGETAAAEAGTQALDQEPALEATIVEPSHSRRNASAPSADSTPIVRLAQGRIGVIPIAVALTNASVPAGRTPLTVSTTLPDGLKLVRTETGGHTSSGGRFFTCKTKAQAVACKLVRRNQPGVAAPLARERRVDLYLVVRAAADLVARGTSEGASPADPGDTVTRLADMPISVSATTDLDEHLRHDFIAQIDATTNPIAPRIFIEQITTRTHKTSSTYRMRLRNIGGLPAKSTNITPALRVREFMPRTPRPVRHSAHGPGWRCDANNGRVTDCTSRAALRPGAATTPITVVWTPQPVFGRADRAPDIWTIQVTAAWHEQIAQDGGVRKQAFTNDFSRRMLLSIHTLKPTTLIAHVRTPNGITIRQGDEQRFVIQLRNNGDLDARKVGLRLHLPRGVRVSSIADNWRCLQNRSLVTCRRTNGGLRAGRTLGTTLTLAASNDAPAGQHTVRLTPFAANDHRAPPHVFPLAINDMGDPEATPVLQFPNAEGHWRAWTGGGFYRATAGRTFRYRALIRNGGGNVLPAGAKVIVSQRVGNDISVVAISTATGATCDDSTARCSISTTGAIAPGQTIDVVEFAVRPTSVRANADLGPIITRIVGEDGDERVPVRVRVGESHDAINLSTRVVQIPDVGGSGAIELRVTNDQQRHRLSDLAVRAPLPRGVALARHKGRGWSCTATSRRVMCHYAGTLRPDEHTSPLRLHLRASRRARPDDSRSRRWGQRGSPAMLHWEATGTGGTGGSREHGSARMTLPIRPAIRIAVEASPRVVIPGKDRRTPRSVVLKGNGSRGNGISLDYQWRQRCTTAADVVSYGRCPDNARAQRVRITSPTAAVARALIPTVTRRTKFVFELTIKNGSSVKSKALEVIAAPTPSLTPRVERRRSGVAIAARRQKARARTAQRAAERRRRISERRRAKADRAAHAASKQRAHTAIAARVRVRTDTSSLITGNPGEEIDLKLQLGKGAEQIRWRQTGGPATTIQKAKTALARVRLPDRAAVLSYTATVTNAAGQVSTAHITVNVLPGKIDNASAPAFCTLVKRASNGTTVSFPGNTSIRFGRVSAPSASTRSACYGSRDTGATSTRGATAGGSFSRSTVAIGALRISNAAGTYSTAGIEVTAGTLTFPSSWNTPSFSIGSAPLSLVFPTGSDTPELSGSITLPSFVFLPLPSGWAGTTTLSFVGGDTTTSATVTASATDGGSGSVTTTGTATKSGIYAADVVANDLVVIHTTPLDLSGNVSNKTGTVMSTVSGSIAMPINLADGVALTTLNATWNATGAQTDTPMVSGNATLALRSGSETPTALAAALSYTSAIDWTVTLSASGGPTWTPLPGMRVTPSDFSGSIGKENGAWQWDIEAQVADWEVTDTLTLSSTRLELTNACLSTNLICPKTGLFMLVDTKATVRMPIQIQPIAVNANAVFGIGGGAGFSLYGDLDGPIDITEGLSITAPSLHVSYALPQGTATVTSGLPTFSDATDSGWSISAVGGLDVPGLGNFADIAANVTSQGVTIGGFDPNGVRLGGPSNGAQSNAAFGWSSHSTTMSFPIAGFGTHTIALKPRTMYVSGSYATPTWFSRMTKTSLPDVIATIEFDPTTSYFEAKVSIPGIHTIPAGGSSLKVTELLFETTNDAQGLTVIAGGLAELGVNAIGNETQQNAPTLTVELSYDITESHIAGTFEFQDTTGWTDAFGIDGLVLDDLAISLGATLTPPIPVPTLGLYASGELPPSLTEAFGVKNAAPVSITAQLSDENPCLSIQVGSSTGKRPIMSIGGGSLTSTYFEFAVAPTGCTVGTSTIQPGMAIAFDGQLFGTTVDVFASLALDPLIFDAEIDVGAFPMPGTTGDVSFQNTVIKVSVNEQTHVNAVVFSGGFSMFGNTIDVSGALTADEATETVTTTLTVDQPQDLTVDGFSLQDLSIAVGVINSPTVAELSVTASGAVAVLGSYIDVEQFTATVDNGVVETVAAQVTTAISLGAADIAGDIAMSYASTTGAFHVNADAVLSTAGFRLPAKLTISPECVAFSGSLAIEDVFTANLEGTMISHAGCATPVRNATGETVQGAPGDFSFTAENVALRLAAFDATGDVAMGNVAGLAYATIHTTLDLSPQSTGDDVTVGGTIESNGNFALVGKADLDIGGFLLAMDVAVHKDGANVAVAGSTAFELYGSTLDLEGEFKEIDGRPSTTLTAVADVSLDGWDMSDARFELNQTPTSAGLSADVVIKAGSIASLDGTMTFTGSDSAPLYYIAAKGTLSIPGLTTAELNGTFTNCTDSSCTLAAEDTHLSLSGDLDAVGARFSFPEIAIASDGAFAIHASVSGNPCSGEIYLLVVRGWGCAQYRETLAISNTGFNVSSDQTITIYYEYYLPFSWHGPNSFAFGAGASIRTDPSWRACLSADVWDGNDISICIP
jgi:hypothetical protein